MPILSTSFLSKSTLVKKMKKHTMKHTIWKRTSPPPETLIFVRISIFYKIKTFKNTSIYNYFSNFEIFKNPNFEEKTKSGNRPGAFSGTNR